MSNQPATNHDNQLNMINKNDYTYGEDITINPGLSKIIQVNGVTGKIYTHDIATNQGRIVIGYTADKKLDFYHIIQDPEGANAINTLEEMGVEAVKNILRINPGHGVNVLINQPTNNETIADGIIETTGRPVMLAPADCLGVCIVHPGTGVYGIFHAGRAGIAENLAAKFLYMIMAEIKEMGGNPNDMQIFIPPHIRGYEYPHANNNFFKTKTEGIDPATGEPIEEDNWWGLNPEFAPQGADGKYHPDIGKAVVAQIRKAVGHKIPITAANLTTYGGNGGVSHSRAQAKLPVGEINTRRNMVTIAFIPN